MALLKEQGERVLQLVEKYQIEGVKFCSENGLTASDVLDSIETVFSDASMQEIFAAPEIV